MRTALLFLSIGFYLSSGAQSTRNREHFLTEVKYYSKQIEMRPADITNYYARGAFYHDLTQWAAANSDMQKVLELYEANPQKKFARVATDACYFLADDYYFRNANREYAQYYVDLGLSITPGDKRFEVLRAGITGSYPERAAEAEKRFEELIAKYPNDEKAVLYYAKFLEERNPEKSIVYYEKAAAINPFNFNALFALGSYNVNEGTRIYRSTGDALKSLKYTKKGVGYFERVYALNPDDKEIIGILIQFYGYLDMTAEQKKLEQRLASLKK